MLSVCKSKGASLVKERVGGSMPGAGPGTWANAGSMNAREEVMVRRWGPLLKATSEDLWLHRRPERCVNPVGGSGLRLKGPSEPLKMSCHRTCTGITFPGYPPCSWLRAFIQKVSTAHRLCSGWALGAWNQQRQKKILRSEPRLNHQALGGPCTCHGSGLVADLAAV